MPNFQAWLGTTAGVKSARAEDAWQRIQQKPSSIVIVRLSSAADDQTLEAQTLRVEYASKVTETGSGGDVSGAGRAAVREVTLFGIKDHPVQPDTDLQRDDQFALDGDVYKVVDVIPSLGEIQAKAMRVT